MVNNNVAVFLGDDTSLFWFVWLLFCVFVLFCFALVQKQGPEPIGYSNGSLFKKQNPQSP